ncbi:MAG: hypothetical protein F4X64_00975 [Chloroflexi bacterium]|nr:hypothetical protein [Chloroflexota bacterium]
MRKLTCYAWGRPGDWEAICVDYDLPAQGETLDEVRRELADAVDTYLEYVADLPASERQAFLNRKAPLSLRLRLSLESKASQVLTALRLTSDRGGLARARFVVTPTA